MTSIESVRLGLDLELLKNQFNSADEFSKYFLSLKDSPSIFCSTNLCNIR